MQEQQQKTAFPSLFGRWSNYLTISFIIMILMIMSFTKEMQIAVALVPVWLLFLTVMYVMKYRRKPVLLPESTEPTT